MFPDLLSLHIEHIMRPVENIPGIVVCGFIIFFKRTHVMLIARLVSNKKQNLENVIDTMVAESK